MSNAPWQQQPNWPPTQPSRFGDDLQPIKAELIQPSGSGGRGCFVALLLAGGCLAFLAMVGVGVYLGFQNSSSTAVARQLSVDESLALAREAFNNFDATVDPTANLSAEQAAEWREIGSFFRHVERTAIKKDSTALGELIDDRRMLQRIDDTGRLIGWNTLDRVNLRKSLRDPHIEEFWAHFVLVNMVTPDDAAETRIVHAFGYNEEKSEQAEFRFWLAKRQEDWKIYDWQRFDIGMPESEEWSYRADYYDDPRMKLYEAFATKMVESDGYSASGELDKAKQALRRANPTGSPREFLDRGWLLLGYRWRLLGDDKEGMRCFDQIKDPAQTPGVHIGRFYTHFVSNDWEAALKESDGYEALVGLTPDLLRSKAEALSNLGRTDEAVAANRRLLRMEPENPSTVAELLVLAPEETAAEVTQWLERQSSPLESAESLVNHVAWREQGGIAMRFLESFVREKAGDSAQAAALAARIAENEGDLPKAAENFRLAAERETDATKRAGYDYNYVSVMARLGRVLEAYEHGSNQSETFNSIVWQYEESEIELSDDEFAKLVARHRELHPDNASGLYRAAQLCMAENDLAEAERLLREGISKLTESDKEEFIDDELQTALQSLLARTGRAVEAYESVSVGGENGEDADVVAFEQLADTLSNSDRWTDLDLLIQRHRAKHADDPMLHYYEGQLRVRQERWFEATAALRRGRDLLDEEDYRHNLFGFLLAQAALNGGNWQQFYAEETDKPRAFNHLCQAFRSRGDLENWRQVRDRHRQLFPWDNELLRQDAEAARQDRDDTKFLEVSDKLIKSSDRAWEVNTLREQRLIAFVRSGQFDAARRAAAEQSPSETWKVDALIAASQGDHAVALPLAMKYAEREDRAYDFYQNDLDASLFMQPEYRPLHEQHPIARIYYAVEDQWLLTTSEPPRLNREQVEQAVRAVFGETYRITATPDDERPDSMQSPLFIIEAIAAAEGVSPSGSRWFVQAHARPIGCSLLDAIEYPDIRIACQQSRGYLVAGQWDEGESPLLDDESHEAKTRMLIRLLAELSAGKGKVWYWDSEWQTLPVDRMEKPLEEDEQPLRTLREQGKALQLSALRTPDERRREIEFEAKLRDAVTSPDVGNPPLRVRIFLHAGQGVEQVWMRPAKTASSYQSLEITGTLEGASLLAPSLTAGTPFQVNLGNVDAFQIGDQAIQWR